MELEEGTRRVFVRRGGVIKKAYKCSSGPRKGRAVSNPAQCFAPRKKASTRAKIARAARKKTAIRVLKSRVAKRKAIHFKLKRLNNMLRGRR